MDWKSSENNVMDLRCSLAAVTDAGLVATCRVRASGADKRVCVCVC